MFSKLKINFLQNNKINSYFKYAIGEIILIVIGISIAVLINGFIENQKQKKLLDNIFVNVKSDLELDMKDLKSYFDIYDQQEKYYDFVLDSLDQTKTIEDCSRCYSIITSSSPFNNRTKGYLQLTNYKEFNLDTSDSLVFLTSNFYATYTKEIEVVNQLLLDNMNDNLNYLKLNYPYFKDVFSMDFDTTKLSFFNNNMEFKNRVALGEVLSYANHVPLLKSYKTNAEKLILDIENRLDDDSD